MAIEIIYKGKVPDQTKYRAACTTCGTVFAVTTSSCTFDKNNCYDFTCTVCEHNVNFQADSSNVYHG